MKGGTELEEVRIGKGEDASEGERTLDELRKRRVKSCLPVRSVDRSESRVGEDESENDEYRMHGQVERSSNESKSDDGLEEEKLIKSWSEARAGVVGLLTRSMERQT
jgi:seryl-tRNA synthetase